MTIVHFGSCTGRSTEPPSGADRPLKHASVARGRGGHAGAGCRPRPVGVRGHRLATSATRPTARRTASQEPGKPGKPGQAGQAGTTTRTTPTAEHDPDRDQRRQAAAGRRRAEPDRAEADRPAGHAVRDAVPLRRGLERLDPRPGTAPACARSTSTTPAATSACRWSRPRPAPSSPSVVGQKKPQLRPVRRGRPRQRRELALRPPRLGAGHRRPGRLGRHPARHRRQHRQLERRAPALRGAASAARSSTRGSTARGSR